MIMAGLSLSIVGMAKSMHVPRTLRMKMLWNIALDFLLGVIPFIGDIADLFYKSNLKNVRIMEEWWLEQKPR